MKKRLVLGALIGLGASAAYQWNAQKASWPNGSVPIGNLLRPTDPLTYVAIALGALVAYGSAK